MHHMELLSEYQMDEMESAVLCGANLLDTAYPDWREDIDPESLEIASESQCILGQLFGDYETGVKDLGTPDPAAYGFEVRDDLETTQEGRIAAWAFLGAMWIKELSY